MSATRHYLANLLAQASGRAVGMGASFLSFVLVARVLGSEALGLYGFLIAFIVTAVTLADFGTTASFTRGIAEERNRDAAGYLGNFLVLRCVLAMAILALGVSVAMVIKPELRHPLLIACAVVPLLAARFFEPVYQVFGRARYAFYSSLVLGASRLTLAAVLLLGLQVGLTGYMYGYAAAQLIYTVFALWLMFRLVRPRFEIRRERLRSIALLAAPIGVAEIFNALYARADVIMLSYLRSAHEVGVYNAAFALLDLSVVVAVTVTMPLVPLLTRRIAEDREAARAGCARIMEIAVIACAPGAILLAYVAEPLMLMIYGPEFADSAPLIVVFGWLFLLTLCFMIGSSINLATGNVGHGYWSSAATAALNIALNFVLIPRYGPVGAAWATAASLLLKLAVSQYYVRVGLGNIYVPGRWLRIGLAVALYSLVLAYSVGDRVVLPILVSSLGYVVLVAAMGLLPLAQLRAIYRRG